MPEAAVSRHDDQSVHGSVWPILAALGATVTLLGILVPVLAGPGVALLAWSVIGWGREDLRHAPAAGLAAEDRGDRWWAVAYLIAGEVVLFGMLFFYYFWAWSHSDVWPGVEPGARMIAYVNTILLLGSGWTAHAAHKALVRGDTRGAHRGLVTTLGLGGAFLALQAYEYATAGFTPASSPFGSAFYGLTGIHGLHVLVGLLVLGAMALTLRRTGDRPTHRGLGAAVLYWHFVDLVWLAILIVVYHGGGA